MRLHHTKPQISRAADIETPIGNGVIQCSQRGCWLREGVVVDGCCCLESLEENAIYVTGKEARTLTLA